MICKHCTQPFLMRRPSDKRVFCSNRCAGLAKRTLPEPEPRPCVVCAKVITLRRKYPQQRYCSKSCQWKADKGPEFNARISRETADARAEAMRGVGHQKWPYRKNLGPHEHRVAAETALGRSLRAGEIVRFLSDDRLNTDPANLEVLPDRVAFGRRVFGGRKHSTAHIAKRMQSRLETLRKRKAQQ